MTRSNVYAGLQGLYLLRGGSTDLPPRALPRGKYEVPLVIHDRSFNADGSLFYAENRAFFEGLNQPPSVPFLDVPYIPDPALGGMSDVAPLWNPEFFGNTVMAAHRECFAPVWL